VSSLRPVVGAPALVAETVSLAYLGRTGRHLQTRSSSWCADTLRVLKIPVTVDGYLPTGPALLVCNHISWLDSLVIGNRLRCAFLAKRELQGWPVVGRVIARIGGISVDRAGGLEPILDETERRLQAGELVCLVPEAATSNGTLLRPFRSGIFEAAHRTGAQVYAVALAYEDADGTRCEEASWTDESFAASLRRVIGRAGSICARVAFRPVACQPSRQATAAAALARVAGVLGLACRTLEEAAPLRAPTAAEHLVARLRLETIRGALPEAVRQYAGRQLLQRTWAELQVDSLDAIPVLLSRASLLIRALCPQADHSVRTEVWCIPIVRAQPIVPSRAAAPSD
jgi:1-acyl-sn-glycerol-3-phosphate acyltransferase